MVRITKETIFYNTTAASSDKLLITMIIFLLLTNNNNINYKKYQCKNLSIFFKVYLKLLFSMIRITFKWLVQKLKQVSFRAN